MATKQRKIRVRAGHGTIRIVERSKPYRAELMVDGTRLSESFTSEEEAQDWLLEVCKRTFKYGISADKTKMTWKEVAELFLESKERSGIKRTTLQDYRQCLRYCACWNNTEIAHLSTHHIERLLSQLAKGTSGHKPLGAKTLRNHFGTIKQILKYALQLEIIDRNVAERLKAPAVKSAPPKAMSKEQLSRFLKILEGDRLEALFWIIFGCGLRKGEAVGLQWSDVDLETGSATIRRRIARLNDGVDIDTPKSRAGQRTVQIPQKALRKLLAWREQQAVEKKLADDRWVEGNWVFTSKWGKWVEPRFINKHLSDVLKKAGADHVTIHQLRHTFCTLLLSQGVPIKDVQEIAGHSRPSVTLNMYYTSLPGASGRVSKKVDELLE